MAEINNDGIESTQLSEYVSDINDIFISVFGDSFNTDPETRQGQLIGFLAQALETSDNSIIDMFNATVIYTAAGSQIDYLASNLDIFRKSAINTEVNVILTGVNGTIIPVGTLAEDTSGNKFTLKEEVTISSGTANGIMVAQDEGEITVLAGTLTKIIDVIAGWETINNTTDGITGTPIETDTQFRNRYLDSVKANSISQIGSIKANLLEIEDVQDAIVIQNDEDDPVVIDNVSINGHTIACVLFGGSDQDIINAIGIKKPVGVPTQGDISGFYTDSSYYTNLAINFYRASQVDIEIELNITTNSNFPSDGINQIKQNIVDYFNGTFEVSPGYETGGYGIADDVIYSRLYTPINQVIGHEVNSYLLGRLGDTLVAADTIIDLTEIATIDSTNINITVT
jgi:uncharacterized phage protein gp47/JayE